MTAKRFTLKEYTIGDYAILDNGTEIAYASYKSAFTFCELLNELHEENQELRLQLNQCSDQRNEFHRGARENANRVGKLEEENKELKKELQTYRKVAGCFNCNYHNYDWYDDGDEFEVCDIGNDVTEGICEKWEEL